MQILSLRYVLSVFLAISASCLFGQWEPDTRLTYDSLYSSTALNSEEIPVWPIATGPGEYVHVFWADNRAGAEKTRAWFSLYYKRSTDGGTTWGADTLLSFGPSPAWTVEPCVAVSDSNLHLLFWSDRNVGYPDIYYKRSTDGGTTWEPDTRLTNCTGFDDMCKGPSIAASVSKVYAVWQRGDESNSSSDTVEIYFKRSTDGGTTWGPAVKLSNSHPKFSSDPVVVASGDTLHVVWAERLVLNFDDKIYYKRSIDGGTTWEPAVNLTNSSSGLHHPSIAFSGQSLHVVWADFRDGEQLETYYKRSTDGGTTWGADTRLSDVPDWSYTACLAVSDNNVHVVWYDERHVSGEIYYKLSTDGGTTWGADTRLTNDPLASVLPSVALSDTSVHVVWADYRDDPALYYNPEIYYKRNPTGNVGVEEKTDTRYQISDFRLKIRPNPFVFYTTVHGYEEEDFTLYDISGRVLGAYKGDRIGVDLSPGVYFLMSENNNTKPIRIVKVR